MKISSDHLAGAGFALVGINGFENIVLGVVFGISACIAYAVAEAYFAAMRERG